MTTVRRPPRAATIADTPIPPSSWAFDAAAAPLPGFAKTPVFAF